MKRLILTALLFCFAGSAYGQNATNDLMKNFPQRGMQNEPPAAASQRKPFPRPRGSVVQLDGRPELYLVVDAYKVAHIQSGEVMTCLGLQARPSATVSSQEFGAMQSLPLLVKGPAGSIYLISGDRKRHITGPEVFQRKGYDPATVVTATEAQLNCIKNGDPVR